MPWHEIDPLSSRPRLTGPVSITLTEAVRRRNRRVYIVIKPNLLVGGLPFWKRGERVSAHLGTGDHHGLLRIEPGKQHKIRAPVRYGAGPMLILKAWPCSMATANRDSSVECDHTDEWIEIVLPEWLKPTEKGTKP